jgi:uncharacterized protein YkwD
MKELAVIFAVFVSSFGFGQDYISSANLRIADSIRQSDIDWNLVYNEFLILLNEHRKSNDLSNVVLDTNVYRAAKFQSEYMLKTNTLSHETNIVGYKTLWDRMETLNIFGSRFGECCVVGNILLAVTKNQSLAESVLLRFIASPGHNKILLMPEITKIGLSVSRSGYSGGFFTCLVVSN